jgi:hypothetical protein
MPCHLAKAWVGGKQAIHGLLATSPNKIEGQNSSRLERLLCDLRLRFSAMQISLHFQLVRFYEAASYAINGENAVA